MGSPETGELHYGGGIELTVVTFIIKKKWALPLPIVAYDGMCLSEYKAFENREVVRMSW